ncbi:glycoside hydrolase [Podospora australis]|uniref:Glycoside hydrolase n=1 Tax=Podospora australis TaxID=1536484 RepID=A0AAN7AQH9_9PEZI|nr:glycoside hydrolase [Podospora australis]
MAPFNNLLGLLSIFLSILLPSVTAQFKPINPPAPLPPLPLHSSSRWILDNAGQRVKLRCVNWAGHMETNIPEGLHRQSIDYIVDWIAAQGFNCVRLTYSTDLALHPSTPVSTSFETVAREWSRPALAALYPTITALNPWITNATTVLDVFAQTVDRLFAKGVMTILDNHVSKASWCCNLTDGNGWWDEAFGYNQFNSRFFNTQDWLSGLQQMAAWSQSHKGVVGMSLRNELRAFLLQDLNGKRQDWYKFIKQGGDLVHATNPDVLVIVGGAQSTTDLIHLRTHIPLDTSGWQGKNVWEMHAYSFTVTFPDPFKNCDAVKAAYGLWSGFVLEQGQSWTGPLILSEFGAGMQGGEEQYDGLNEKDNRYLNCLISYMQNNDAEWAVWAVQGSYYIRDGQVDLDEGWGMMNHEWQGWRNHKFPERLGDMWKMKQKP